MFLLKLYMSMTIVGKKDALKEKDYPDALNVKAIDHVWDAEFMTMSLEAKWEGKTVQLMDYEVGGYMMDSALDYWIQFDMYGNALYQGWHNYTYYMMQNETSKVMQYHNPHTFRPGW